MEEQLQPKEKVGCLDKVRHIKPEVVLMVMLFSCSSWVDLMGVWVELPIMVHMLPEGWNLPSYVMAAMQLAIITPIIYSLVNKFCPGNVHLREVFMIYFIMAVGFFSLLFLSFFWDSTVFLAGADRSVAALSLIFLLSMVDTTSCIVYLPYMSCFKAEYIPAYIAGEEASGLITGIVGFIQGAGGEAICNNVTVEKYNETLGLNYTEFAITMTHQEARFSVQTFFIILIFIMAMSAGAFTILNFTSFAQSEKVGKYAESKDKEMEVVNGTKAYPPLMEDEKEDNKVEVFVKEKVEDEDPKMQRGRLLTLCALQVWNAGFIFGVYPSVLSYSCLPYSPLTYTLTMRLICVVNPITALLSMFVQIKKPMLLVILVAVSSVVAAYHILLAAYSPDPPLEHYAIGAFIAVFTAVAPQACCAYARACVTIILRTEGGHRALLLGGFCLQIGVFFGGLIGFLMVSVFELFEQEMPCSVDDY